MTFTFFKFSGENGTLKPVITYHCNCFLSYLLKVEFLRKMRQLLRNMNKKWNIIKIMQFKKIHAYISEIR